MEASAWISDNEWILDASNDEPFILGLVGRLEPEDAAFERDLERFQHALSFAACAFGATTLPILTGMILSTRCVS